MATSIASTTANGFPDVASLSMTGQQQESQPPHPVDIVVLGSGVIGLVIAHELTNAGYKVGVVGRDLPGDSESAAFASPWAGAHWDSFQEDGDSRAAGWDKTTFKAWEAEAKECPEMLQMLEFKYVSSEPNAYEKNKDKWWASVVKDFKPLPTSDLPPGYASGTYFRSYNLHTPLYLAHLGRTLSAKGVPIIRRRLSALDEAYSLPEFGPVSLVVNATGLGARTLLGVEDPAVYPGRGQAVLVRSPRVRANWCCLENHPDYSTPGKERRFYLIPRPGPDNHIVLGGSFVKHSWNTQPDPAVAEDILREAYDLVPALAEGRDKGKREGEGWKEIEVVGHFVGLRPCREGGMRLELERRKVGDGLEGREGLLPARAKGMMGKEVACVHAYGIGPAGYQASRGVAQEVVAFTKEWSQGSRAD